MSIDSAEQARPFPLRKALIGSGAAVLVLGGVYLASHRGAAQPAETHNQAALVTVGVPGRTQVAGTITVTGAIAARHDMPVGAVGDGGQVVRVLVNAGEWVKRGQLLAVIDRQVQIEQQANQAANIRVSEADARLAEANLQRAQKLVAGGFISAADIDRLTATRDAANARVKVAQAQLGETRARIRRLDIVAPADGLVLDRAVEPGQVVSPGSGVLFRIAEKGEMELKAHVSETDLAQMAVGQEVRVTPTGGSKGFVGHIWQVSPIIDPTTRQGSARIALTYAPELRPGGFASAEILSGTINAPLLPESALQADNQGNYVFVVGPDNRVSRRRIKLAMVTDKGVAIADGLSGNERIVLRAGAFLSDGETVNPRMAPGK